MCDNFQFCFITPFDCEQYTKTNDFNHKSIAFSIKQLGSVVYFEWVLISLSGMSHKAVNSVLKIIIQQRMLVKKTKWMKSVNVNVYIPVLSSDAIIRIVGGIPLVFVVLIIQCSKSIELNRLYFGFLPINES